MTRRIIDVCLVFLSSTLKMLLGVFVLLLLLKFSTEEPHVDGCGDALLRRVHARLHRPLVIIRHAIRGHPEHFDPASH